MSGERPDAEPEHDRYQRIVAAAGLRPDIDLSPEAQVVLAWLARQDDTVTDGVIEIVDAAGSDAHGAHRWEATPGTDGARTVQRRPGTEWAVTGDASFSGRLRALRREAAS